MSTENDSETRTIERLTNEDNRITPKHWSSSTRRNTSQVKHNEISFFAVNISKSVRSLQKLDQISNMEQGFQNQGLKISK